MVYHKGPPKKAGNFENGRHAVDHSLLQQLASWVLLLASLDYDGPSLFEEPKPHGRGVQKLSKPLWWPERFVASLCDSPCRAHEH